jgi:hypothetical protein
MITVNDIKDINTETVIDKIVTETVLDYCMCIIVNLEVCSNPHAAQNIIVRECM